MFNGEHLMSGRALNLAKLTKQDLTLRAQSKKKIEYTHVHFGAHKGTSIKEVPVSYFKFSLEEMTFDSVLMKEYKEAILKNMEYREDYISKNFNLSNKEKKDILDGIKII